MPVDIQLKFTAFRRQLDQDDGFQRFVEHFGILSGERPGDKEREAEGASLFDNALRRGESITDYVLRRDAKIGLAEVYGLQLADSVLARLLEEGANLSPQNRIDMCTLAGGKLDHRSIRETLLKLDIREKGVLSTSQAMSVETFVTEEVFEGSSSASAGPVDVSSRFAEPPDDAFELPEEGAEAFLSALEEQELLGNEGRTRDAHGRRHGR
ncbi:unnamed protein product [Prorocentrum cordatum]|uniref:Uncharacterized protein n=1 Tax=Prorocentrum cordatum TaxID=2364126 RepID=A0ABN9WDB3_9DINO|nr:unnamed protein product [Polarella glacialis]